MRTIVLIAALVFVAAYGVYAIVTVDRRDDLAQITSLVQSAVEAGRERNFSATMSCVSSSYKDDNGMNYDQLRLFMNRAMTDSPKYRLDATPPQVTVDGSKSTVKLTVQVITLQTNETIYHQALTLLLDKEDGRRALLIPAKVWRVTNVKNLGYGPDAL